MIQPSWLDASFVEKVLREADDDDSIEVSSMTVKPALAKGDNYASDIHRLGLELSRIRDGARITEHRSVIAKLTLQGGAWNEVVRQSGMFVREMSMMTEILPKMNEMIAEFSTTPLSARCLQVRYEAPMYLMVEDLLPRGFRMFEARGCFDLDHSLFAMRNMAVFHAASVAIAEKDPESITKYKRYWRFGRDFPSFNAFVDTLLEALAKEVAHWPELSPQISEKILKLRGKILVKERDAALFNDDDFNVLNHGDCSSINMLFRYNENGKPIDHTFVDFQLCRYGTPAIDILNFFATSTTVDVRLDNRESLVREYHESLTRTMDKLGCATKPPSLDDLKRVIKERAFCEVTPSLTVLPHALAEKNQSKSGNEAMDQNHTYTGMYGNKNYCKVMTRMLPIFDSEGLLDV